MIQNKAVVNKEYTVEELKSMLAKAHEQIEILKSSQNSANVNQDLVEQIQQLKLELARKDEQLEVFKDKVIARDLEVEKLQQIIREFDVERQALIEKDKLQQTQLLSATKDPMMELNQDYMIAILSGAIPNDIQNILGGYAEEEKQN